MQGFELTSSCVHMLVLFSLPLKASALRMLAVRSLSSDASSKSRQTSTGSSSTGQTSRSGTARVEQLQLTLPVQRLPGAAGTSWLDVDGLELQVAISLDVQQVCDTGLA